MSNAKSNYLTPCRKMTAVYCGKRTKLINTYSVGTILMLMLLVLLLILMLMVNIIQFTLVLTLLSMLKQLTLTHLPYFSLIPRKTVNKNACKFKQGMCLTWVKYSVRIPVNTLRNISLTFEANIRMIQNKL